MQRRWLILLIVTLGALPLLVACGDNDDPDPTATAGQGGIEASATPEPATPTTSAPPTASSTPENEAATPSNTIPPAKASATLTPAPEPLTLSVYYIRDGKLAAAHREVPHTVAVGTAAIEQLLAGPAGFEVEVGFTSAIPDGAALLGLEVASGIATVDLSAEFETAGGSLPLPARLAQVTFTLTQFSTVEAVEFLLEGQPVEAFGDEGITLDQPLARSDFEELLPAIFVESPAVGDSVESPLRVWGTANTFEATFMLNVVDPEGLIIAEEVVTATSGTGTRGTFEVIVEFDVAMDGMGAVIVFENSARDGEPINIVEIPVEMTG